MSTLRTDYQDDVFEGSRKYTMVTNTDGTVSFVDATEYSQVGSTYGAAEINEQNDTINKKGVVVSNTDIDIEDRITGNMYFFYS